jgi:DNA-binding HxlR family transcriptional regulator
MESVMPATRKKPGKPAVKPRVVPPAPHTPEDADPRVDALVHELIGRVADKWTMIVLEVLAEHGEVRFSTLAKLAGGISQKMLTQTLRQMERDGLVVRTVHPVIPPRVEYRRTDLGDTLGLAFCGVWEWAAKNRERVDAARAEFDRRTAGQVGGASE